MRLRQLAIAGFRNMEMLRIEPGERFNLLYGLNGQGKTNLLEAIYLLGSPRSFRSTRLPELIRHGDSRGQVRGLVESGGVVSRLRLVLEQGGRRVDIDGKSIQRASDLHGKLNAVVFSPEDTAMVRMGPDYRRRYLDRAVYMSDIGYLHCWHDYQRTLKQRNQLLKQADRSGMDIWTERLAEAGAEVIERRIRFVDEMNARQRQHYRAISGGSEESLVRYRPEGVEGQGHQELKAALLDLFQRHERADERAATTTAGPHRDDLQFLLDGRSLKAFGSQGQQKSFVLALKMAEMDHLEAAFGDAPLLLLDDMSSELDPCRHKNLMEFLVARGIQVFITTTERSAAVLGAATACAVFHVEAGNLTFEGNQPT